MKHQDSVELPAFIIHPASHAYRPQIQQRRLGQIHQQRSLIQISTDTLQFITLCGNFQWLRHQRRMPVYNLHCLWQALPQYSRAQYVVSRHYFVQGVSKILEPLLRIK